MSTADAEKSMTDSPLPRMRSIMHPTDFSVASGLAFDHALRIALSGKTKLHLLHVGHGDPELADWTAFPGVRRTLSAWGLLPEGSPREAVAKELGIYVSKIEMVDRGAVRGILRYLEQHPTDLIVLATHGRHGLPRWLQGSIAEPVAREAPASTLCIRHGARGFVLPDTGEVRLRHVLVPVDHKPRPAPAVEAASQLAAMLGANDVTFHLLHIGDAGDMPAVVAPSGSPRIERIARRGAVVAEILAAANELQVDLIVMASAGRQGFLDEVRGSTTERVLRDAPCPVLVVPVD
jgi:nucleotide-binding universal stress UspA family protein